MAPLMDRPSCDTLIISDVHLGSEVSQAKAALRMLKSIDFQRLILLGDIFCDLDFGRLKKDHWDFLGYIRKLSNPKRGKEIVWVEGNHDKGLATLMSHLVGVPVYQMYTWESAGKRNIAVHGHQFDHFSLKKGPLCKFGQWIYLVLQKLDSEKQRVTRLLDRINTRWLDLTAKVRRGALHLATHHGAHRIICGHTHVALKEIQKGIEYLNSGAWISDKLSYIAINGPEAEVCYWGDENLGVGVEEPMIESADAEDFPQIIEFPAAVGAR